MLAFPVWAGKHKTYVQIQLAIVSPLILAGRFGVFVTLMDQEVIRQDVERHSREVELEEAGGFTESAYQREVPFSSEP